MADIKKAKYNEPGVFEMYEDDMWSIPYYASKMESQLMPYGSNGNIETKPVVSKGIDQIKGYVGNIQQTFESMIRDNIYDVVKGTKKSKDIRKGSEVFRIIDEIDAGLGTLGGFIAYEYSSKKNVNASSFHNDIQKIRDILYDMKDALKMVDAGLLVSNDQYDASSKKMKKYLPDDEDTILGFIQSAGSVTYEEIEEYADGEGISNVMRILDSLASKGMISDDGEEYNASTKKMKKSNIKRVISKIVEYGRMSDVQKSKITKDYNGWTNYETWAFATYEMDEINTFINNNIETGQYKSDSDIMDDISSCIDSVIDDMYEEADGLRSGAMRDIATMGIKRIDDNDIKMAIWRDVGPNFDRYMETDKSTKKSKTESFNAMVNNIRVKNNTRKV